MILALLFACGLAWLVCERQSRVYARHDARDRADAGWNALQPPVAGAKVWTDAAKSALVECVCYGGPIHGKSYMMRPGVRYLVVPVLTPTGIGRVRYERSGDVLLCIDPETREAA